MGQYHIIVNLDKKEYLHPHNFNDGLKFLEFVNSGTTLAMCVLMAHSNGLGGGDFTPPDLDYINKTEPMRVWDDKKGAFIKIQKTFTQKDHDEICSYMGHWVGDRVIILGDYSEYERPILTLEEINSLFNSEKICWQKEWKTTRINPKTYKPIRNSPFSLTDNSEKNLNNWNNWLKEKCSLYTMVQGLYKNISEPLWYLISEEHQRTLDYRKKCYQDYQELKSLKYEMENLRTEIARLKKT